MQSVIKDIKTFIHFTARELGLSSIPTVNLVGSSENEKNSFGHFIGERKGKSSITVRITNRHPVDVMRTLAHELIHYHQLTKNVRSSEQMKEDEANKLAGRIMRKFDNAYPKVFKQKPILEDGVAVNAMGTSSSTAGTGAIDTYDPLLQFKSNKKKTGMLRRKAPVSENILTKTIANNITDRSSISKNKPKKLRDIVAHDERNDQRADTRIS